MGLRKHLGLRKHIFSIEHEERDGRLSELSYDGVIRVLEPGAVPQKSRKGYHALKGSAPPDPKDGAFAAWYGCPGGKLCFSCTGKPDCNGGPPPDKAALFAKIAPGVRTILVKTTVQLAVLPNGQQYLFDAKGDPGIRIPVFDAPTGVDLGPTLQQYRIAAKIRSRSIAFHIYQITIADALPLAGKLIGVPVGRGRVRLATRRKAS
jgi:hypothetical protein